MGTISGVKVFTATRAEERMRLGEHLERWSKANPQHQIVDTRVVQSSDRGYHCLSIVVLYRPAPMAAARQKDAA